MIRTPRKRRASRPRTRPRLERLEDRLVPAPTILDPALGVRAYAAGLAQPTGMAFIGENDLLINEKATGRVQRVINGVLAGPVLDLAVNSNSERGLLGMALSPNFATDRHVYLFWTQSSTGADTNVAANVPLLGNRVDRFVWNGSTLSFDRNIIQLRSRQADAGQPERGNHDGGVIRFGPDGKLYIITGDTGRRGWTQNINAGFGPNGDDDQFGGPETDPAHLTGVVLRLNPDGSTPTDNPFTGIRNLFTATLTGDQEVPARTTTARGFATLGLNQAMTALTLSITVTGIDFTGQQTPNDPNDLLLSAHIHAPAAPGTNAGVVFGFLGTPFNDINPNDFVVTPFAEGVGGTITAKWDLTEGNNTTLAAQLPAILAGNAYLNFHTARFQGGEIRGQILPVSREVLATIHKIYAYGVRNSFGLAFDPITGALWNSENSDDSFEEINRIEPGHNGGWTQIMGPVARIFEFKGIETTPRFNGLQQLRWPPTLIAETPEEALARLFKLPGSHYSDPEFSFRFAVPLGGIGFLNSNNLGQQYAGDLFIGGATANTDGGHLFRFQLNEDRTAFVFNSSRLADNVEDNFDKHSLTEGREIRFGTNFGVTTDIQTGPNGNLFVLSLSDGTLYEIFQKDSTAAFASRNLVSNIADPPGGAPTIIDTDLKNPWGISFSGTSPFWVANQGTGTSTLYRGDVTQADGTISPFTKVALTVTIPPNAARPAGSLGLPTGTVFNGTTGFVLSNGRPANFIFASLDGVITAWNGGAVAEIKATVPGAVYTGLAIGNNGSRNFLYAANLSQGRIDVFDENFQLVTQPGQFEFLDPNLPGGPLTPFRPFNIQNLNGTLYVAYEIPGATPQTPGPGGVVNAFDTNGNFLRRVVTSGLNAPWGLALAPANFGRFSGALLVGNFDPDDGKINAFNAQTGQFLGHLSGPDGNPLRFEHLWSITPGNGTTGDRNALYFAAGINGEQDGLFGSIRLVVAASAGFAGEEGDGSGGGGNLPGGRGGQFGEQFDPTPSTRTRTKGGAAKTGDDAGGATAGLPGGAEAAVGLLPGTDGSRQVTGGDQDAGTGSEPTSGSTLGAFSPLVTGDLAALLVHSGAGRLTPSSGQADPAASPLDRLFADPLVWEGF